MGGAPGRSRAAIEKVAARLFAERGYAATSVRDIARQSSADPAIVIRHFGSKEELFLLTMRIDPEDMLVLDPPLNTLAERIIGYVLDADDEIRNIYLALVRASDSGHVSAALSTAHEEGFIRPLREVLDGEDRDLRARLIASMVGGLMYSLWIAHDRELAVTSRRDLVERYGPMLNLLIDPGQ